MLRWIHVKSCPWYMHIAHWICSKLNWDVSVLYSRKKKNCSNDCNDYENVTIISKEIGDQGNFSQATPCNHCPNVAPALNTTTPWSNERSWSTRTQSRVSCRPTRSRAARTTPGSGTTSTASPRSGLLLSHTEGSQKRMGRWSLKKGKHTTLNDKHRREATCLRRLC